MDPFAPALDFSEVYLEHAPTNWGTDKPLNAFNIWNLDTGTGHSDRLSIMDTGTKAYWHSDPLTDAVLGKYKVTYIILFKILSFALISR
ncbi:hypothetical protein SAMN05421740_10226 [Parapedobacter koreensis]|uniref:Uncharacterized protein n=1 Tax=Parapedobacter koreensis TaxID=332977 RepID=A0A1H7HV17_9SPHI|nr:hypothetical protein SAMN05421740_10226 [Parapedobacter koreensis]